MNAVTVDRRTGFGIATASGVVDLAQNKFEITLGRLFCAVQDTF
jgi:hypothetical protein